MSWASASLEELCEINVGRTPARANPEFWGRGEPWLSIADMNQGRVITSTKEEITAKAAGSGRVVKPGTVLLSFKLSIGKVAVAGIPLYTNEAIAALPIKRTDRLLPEFLARTLEAQDLTGGSNRAAMGATLNKAKLKQIQIPLPPVDEQRRIAAILEQADALRAKRRRALAHLDDLTQSIFHRMFGHLLPDRELLSVCSKITDGTHQSPDWAAAGVPFIFISNIITGEIDLGTKKFVSSETWTELTRRTPIEIGDILYSTVGSFGVPAMVRTAEHFAFQRHIAHIKPIAAKVNPEFLSVQLKSARVKQQAVRAARGVAQPTVNLADIKKFRIVVPPMGQQDEFVALVRSVAKQRNVVASAVDQEGELFASIQSRAFRGDL